MNNILNIFIYNFDSTVWYLIPIQFIKNCKYAFQRAIRGYSDVDLIFLDCYIAEIFSSSLMDYIKEDDFLDGDEIYKIAKASGLLHKYNKNNYDVSENREFLEALRNLTQAKNESNDLISAIINLEIVEDKNKEFRFKCLDEALNLLRDVFFNQKTIKGSDPHDY